MNLFFSDLLADLREKRLWPVAVLLLVGLVAVPLVVAKPAPEPQPQGPDPVAQDEGLPEAGVRLLTADSGRGSALDLFDPKDPFRPPESILAADQPADAGANAGGGSSGGGSAPDSGGGSGSTGGTDTGGSGGGGGEPAPPVTRTQHFTYVLDVTFRSSTGSGTRTRRIKGMRRLDMLPSESNPLLIFMGVGAGGSNAVFLIDSTLEGAGEGRCKPSASDCSFLYMGAGSEHEFNNDEGDSYVLRIDQIRRVKVRAASAKKSGKGSRKAAGSRRFTPPALVDQVDVATTTNGDSSDSTARR